MKRPPKDSYPPVKSYLCTLQCEFEADSAEQAKELFREYMVEGYRDIEVDEL